MCSSELMAPSALPPRPPLAPPAQPTPLAALRAQLALSKAQEGRLHLRFERVHRFGGTAPLAARPQAGHGHGHGCVGVFVSWQARCVRAGEVQHLIVLREAEAWALQADCARAGLRFVDNL